MENNLNTPATNDKQFFTAGDGCRIAYRIDGEAGKPILVLANSIATDYHMWDTQIPEFSKHFRVIRFDTRGNGASDAPEGDYSIDRMGHDVIELLDYLPIERINFCGLSLGGFIGQWLGIHAPERLDKLILANTSSYLGPHNSWDENIKQLRNGGDMNKFADMFMNNWFPKEMIDNDNGIVAMFRNMVLKTKPVGLAGSFAAVRDADFRRTTAVIPNATLIIAGKYDQVTIAQHSELMAKTIKGSKLVILPSVHMTNVQYPHDLEKLIIDFIVPDNDQVK